MYIARQAKSSVISEYKKFFIYGLISIHPRVQEIFLFWALPASISEYIKKKFSENIRNGPSLYY